MDLNPAYSRGTPASEVAIDRAMVSKLLADQHPDLAGLSLRAVEAGWDNAMFRLGDHFAVRLPRRSAAAKLILHEQTWLPRLAGHLTLPVPSPCRVGSPSSGYPWAWSVVPWLNGATVDQQSLNPDQAARFGSFLRSLHVAAPNDVPQNPVRGVPLQTRLDVVAARMERLAIRSRLITPEIRQLWQEALAAPMDVPVTWLHGDLHPRNVLVEQGVLSGIIDWGDLCSGDRATDLASLWMLFAEPSTRAAALGTYGDVSPATLVRARGWALLLALVLLETGLTDNPPNALIGQRTLSNLLLDCQAG